MNSNNRICMCKVDLYSISQRVKESLPKINIRAEDRDFENAVPQPQSVHAMFAKGTD